jgi:hypothetical protein
VADGKAGDGGVDARGEWSYWPLLTGEEAEEFVAEKIGRSPRRSRIIVQCKATGKPVPAAFVRELIGAYLDVRSGSRLQHLDSSDAASPASPSAHLPMIKAARLSRIPLVLIHLEPSQTDALAASARSKQWLQPGQLQVRGYTTSQGLDDVVACVVGRGVEERLGRQEGKDV